MRRIVFVFFLSGLCSSLFGQFNNDFLYYIKYGRSVSAHAEYDFNSTAIQNAFVNRFIQGGHLDSMTKANVENKLMSANRAGGSYAAGVTAFWGFKNSKYSFVTGLKQVEFFNSTFSDDFFSMAFFGNKMFAGKTANIGGTTVNHFKFQEVKLGLIWDKIDTSARVGFSVSYLKGQNLFQVNTGSSSVYTAADASEIYLNMHGSFTTSDTAKNKQGLGAFNGNGASAEFFADMPYEGKLGPSKFYISVNNLGFIHWNTNTLNLNFDTNYIYRGITINNLFQVSDTAIKHLSKDSITKHFIISSKQKKSTNLPTSFLLMHTIKFSNLFSLTNGFRHIFQGNYKPYVFAEGQFTICKSFITTIHVGIGGYGKMTYGLNVEYNYKMWYLRIGSNALQGFIAPKQTLGQGLFVSLSKKL
ncbi:MAG TPA: DUF5723 family protein [Bacteroidia bacterium]|jgi:hypothetical protein|nr:DUF5723 family protein [Bacteroidia bacterium]